MTVQRLVVLLQGQPVGAIDRDRRADLRFSYLDEWRSRPDATPLSVSLPLAAGAHDREAVESFLWGLLPDNTDVLIAWGRRFQVTHRDAFSLLSTPGRRGLRRRGAAGLRRTRGRCPRWR